MRKDKQVRQQGKGAAGGKEGQNGNVGNYGTKGKRSGCEAESFETE